MRCYKWVVNMESESSGHFRKCGDVDSGVEISRTDGCRPMAARIEEIVE